MINPRNITVTTLEVTSQTIQQHDVVDIGGQRFEVLNMFELHGQAKGLRFTTGEVLTIHSKTRLSVTRAVRRG
ncbi:hypothetical protein AB0I66_26920 [Streptomyces sp. NPDC050439]|uniref:hypothetical protein n=1 Tax=unclassified Streptomyces TaxID=2593676 RepID=UPI00341D7866